MAVLGGKALSYERGAPFDGVGNLVELVEACLRRGLAKSRVYGFEFQLQSVWSRIQDVGCRVHGLGFRV